MSTRKQKWESNSLLKNETATGKITVLITRCKGVESRGLPGNKENKMAEKPLPRNGGLHRRGQGAKTSWQRSPFSQPCGGERDQREKKPHSIWNSVIIKVPLPLNNNQQGTRTKHKETWTPKPVKRCQAVCSTSPDRVSLPAAAASSTAAAGIGQQLELMEGLGLCLSRRSQACGWGSLDSAPSRFSWALLVGWSDHTEGALFSFPILVPWLPILGDSNEKERKEKRPEENILPGPETKTKGSFCLVLPQLLSSQWEHKKGLCECCATLKGNMALPASANLGKTFRFCFWPAGLKGRVTILGRWV